MTWTQMLLTATHIETWTCGRFYNPGPDLFIFRLGHKRMRSDHKKAVTVKELQAAGYRKVHTTAHPNTPTEGPVAC